MSWLDNKHLTTPGTSTYWIIDLALTCGGMTSSNAWQATTPADLARKLAVVAKRADLELLGVYRHQLVIEAVEPLTPAELAAMQA